MKLQYPHVFSVGLFLAGLMAGSFAQAEPVKVIGDSPVTLPAMREPTVGILQPFVVHHESLDHILAKVLICPCPKLRPPTPPNPEPDGDDHLQGVEGDIVFLAVGGSCKVILYN